MVEPLHLDDVGDEGSAMRSPANSLLASAEKRIIYRQESDSSAPLPPPPNCCGSCPRCTCISCTPTTPNKAAPHPWDGTATWPMPATASATGSPPPVPAWTGEEPQPTHDETTASVLTHTNIDAPAQITAKTSLPRNQAGQASIFSSYVDLRREFGNPGSAARTVCSRWSRGIYRISKRSPEPCVVDSRGQSVHSLGMAQTFLTDAEIDELVAVYEAGATLRGLAKQFHIHRLIAAAHLAHRSVPVRRAGLDSVQAKEAARLYQAGWTLVQLGRRFEVDAQTVRRTIARQGVSIRPGGRPRRRDTKCSSAA